ASRERELDQRRASGPARSRPARTARRRDAHDPLTAPPGDRGKPHRRRRRAAALALADHPRLERAGLPTRAPPQPAALPLAAARRDLHARGARRPPADRPPPRDPPADELRADRQDPFAGRLDRAPARPGARPDRADRAGVTQAG